MKEMGEIRCFLLDMDGTINLGQRLLPGAKEFIDYIRESGRDYLFLTNNSSKDGSHYVEKMTRLGIACDMDHILTSGDATVLYINQKKKDARVFLMGTPELERTFRAGSITLTDEDPDFVVLGFDMTMTYEKIRKGCDLVRAGVPYLATHPDFNCPVEDGYIPDTGAMIAMIKASTGKEPKVIGKPNAEIIRCAFARRASFSPDAFAMVGDRVYTDIKTGANAGIASILVLSGESTVEDLAKCGVEATFVADGVGEIHRQLVRYDEAHA